MHTFDPPEGFSITRLLPAPPQHVWEALTDPNAMAAWWHTRNAITPVEEVQADVQIGGHYRYTMVNKDSGDRVVTRGIYQELDAPHRIAFTWGEPGTATDDTPLVSMTLEPEEHGTLMFFELRGASGAPGDHFFYDGWAEVLDSFADYLTAQHEGG